MLLLLASPHRGGAVDDGARTETAELLSARIQLQAAQHQAATFKAQAERAVQARLDAEIARARQAADEQRENIATATAASRPLLDELKSEKEREHTLQVELQKSQAAQARLKQDAERALASANAAMTKSEATARQLALVEERAKEKDASWEQAAEGTLDMLREDQLDESREWEKLRHREVGAQPDQKRQALLLETRAGAAKPVSPDALVSEISRMVRIAHTEREGTVDALRVQQDAQRARAAREMTGKQRDFDEFRKTLDSLESDKPFDVGRLV